jgi:outer membrane murein-binding lipoprotein Lpp
MKTKFFISVLFIMAIFILAGCINSKGSEPTKAPEVKTQTSTQNSQSAVKLENKLVALGSSLTRASNVSTDKQGENNDYSFSIGTKIESLYLYLKSQESGLSIVNLASPGAEMIDILERQLPAALPENPKYVSLDPGADIVSSNPSVSRLKQNLVGILEKINPATTVFLFSYPNFTKMRTADFSSCQENKVGVSLENLSEKNVLAFNQAMAQVVATRPNVIFIDIYNLLGPGDISDYDCLHINVSGQQKIAAEFIKKLK